MKLTPQQLKNWRNLLPELRELSDDLVQKFFEEYQRKLDSEDTCDVRVNGSRCGIIRRNHGSHIFHPFMASP